MSARSRGNEVRVGVLVILAVTVFIVGLLWFRGFDAVRSHQRVTARFPNATGLLEGDPVEVHGVSAGEVETIDLDGEGARLILELDRDVALRADASARIENVGIMGQKRVVVDPGTPAAGDLEPGGVIHGEVQPSVTDAVGDMRGVAAAIESLSVRIGVLLDPVGASAGSSLVRSLDDVETASAHLAAQLSDGGGVDRTLGDARRTLGHVDSLVTSEGVAEAVRRLSTIAVQLDSTLSRIDRVSARGDSLLAGLEAGRGTVGALLTDAAFRDSLAVTLTEARALIRDIREHPDRYVDVSIF